MSADVINVVTIDGPSGSGKGTIAKMLAQELGYRLLDSGALYRLLGLHAQRKNINLEQAEKHESVLASLAESLPVEFQLGEGEGVTTLLDGEDVGAIIRTEKAGKAASQVACLPLVREALLSRQRDFAQAPGLVADGRDMGTVVFPEALTKVYLTASAEERAQRRYKQLNNSEISLEGIVADIKARDDRDMNRAVAPLRPADDAIQIDSTAMSIDAVFGLIVKAL